MLVEESRFFPDPKPFLPPHATIPSTLLPARPPSARILRRPMRAVAPLNHTFAPATLVPPASTCLRNQKASRYRVLLPRAIGPILHCAAAERSLQPRSACATLAVEAQQAAPSSFEA
ncbi:hypothetical protein PMIN01_04868 [Paraphaeosphaeria minitans]|uniref:Uncharacterized protein n=1 Tax=Paraphaeosphaeria minitans TaxID=565426 RepID=A0A9P6GN14_9PLEO|nr:hypothetical protein PMIN01_04868 [Paraphaeosphaeria minitans]